MKTLIERLREEAEYTHKMWYRVADDETRKACRALTIEAADRIEQLERDRCTCGMNRASQADGD